MTAIMSPCQHKISRPTYDFELTQYNNDSCYIADMQL